jgi:monovalent cation:H+ antiporter-2, CPA2 family
MTEGPGLTLLIALAAALLLGSLALRLHLPPMIGYVAAGLAVGPFTPGFVADREQVLALADIGVALLMFSIGLRFSIREVTGVGRLVLLGAPVQVALTIGLGLAVSFAFGWDLTQAVFVGALASVCSSVVLVKIAGETGIRATPHGRLAFAWSVVQDILTVALVVVLTALATAGANPVLDVARSTALAVAFIGAVAFGGSRVFPVVLGQLARFGSREIFVVGVAVLAIGTAFAATTVGVSIALGAFVAGLALGDSDLTASVLGEVVPLRELFATFFFVSIGIVVEPRAIADGLPIFLALLGVIVLGKGLLTAGITWLGGHPPLTALLAGGLLAQSGEFSFVLATAGRDVGALEGSVFSLAIGAVVASIVLAGPTFAAAGALGHWLGSRLPARGELPASAEPSTAMRRHAVILGFGRVGRTVARYLGARGFPWVAIDADYRLVREARLAGAPILYGDAGNPVLLDEARVAEATVMVIAIPDPLAAAQAVEHAVRRNPRIDTVARVHRETDEQDLRRRGVTRVVVADREVANELVHHALRRFGVSEREIAAMLQARREQA